MLGVFRAFCWRLSKIKLFVEKIIFVTDPTFHYSSGSSVGTGTILKIPSKGQRLRFNILDFCLCLYQREEQDLGTWC